MMNSTFGLGEDEVAAKSDPASKTSSENNRKVTMGPASLPNTPRKSSRHKQSTP